MRILTMHWCTCAVELESGCAIIHQKGDEAPVGVLATSKFALLWLAFAREIVDASQLVLGIFEVWIEIVLGQI